MRNLTVREVVFEVYTRADDTDLEGNVMASGDDAADAEAEQDIRDRLNAGDETAWCGVCVRASWQCAAGIDYQGDASLWGNTLSSDYTAATVAEQHGLYQEALEDLNAALQLQAKRGASIERKLGKGEGDIPVNQEQFKKAWIAIETEVLAGRMSVSGGMARVTVLALDYARYDAREAVMTADAIEALHDQGKEWGSGR